MSQFARDKTSLDVSRLGLLDVPSPLLPSYNSSPKGSDKGDQENDNQRSLQENDIEGTKSKNDLNQLDLTFPMVGSSANENFSITKRFLNRDVNSMSNASINQLKDDSSSPRGENSIVKSHLRLGTRMPSQFYQRSEIRKGTLELVPKYMELSGKANEEGKHNDVPALSLISRPSSKDMAKEQESELIKKERR